MWQAGWHFTWWHHSLCFLYSFFVIIFSLPLTSVQGVSPFHLFFWHTFFFFFCCCFPLVWWLEIWWRDSRSIRGSSFICVCVCLHIFQPLQYFAADLIEYSGCTEFLEYLIASIKIQKVSVTSVPPFHDNVPVPELAHLCTSCAPRWPT